MRIQTSWILPGLMAALAFTLLAGLPGAAQTVAKSVVLEGARLIDGTGHAPIENSVLVIEADRIRAVFPAAATGQPQHLEGAGRVDLRGKTLMPALINLHGHLGLTQNGLAAAGDSYTEENIRAQLEKYLAYGVGTVLALGTDQELIYRLRTAQRAGNFPAARIYTAGRGFGVAGGYPPATASSQGVYRPENPDQARAQVGELASHHPDFVKIWVDDEFGRLPKMKPEIYRAIIEEAHRRHLRVIAHVFYLADAKDLVRAGVDGLGHSVRDVAVDGELIDAMKARGVFLLPTLIRDESTFIYAQGAAWLEDPFFQNGVAPAVLTALRSRAFIEKFGANPDLPKLQAAFEMARKNLKALTEAGVRIALGTDSGPPLRFQGYFEHRELQLMVECGITPMQAIVAGTSAAAQALGAPDLGTLEPNHKADFLVLDANPLEDIHNTEKLSAVYQSGRPTHAPGKSQPVIGRARL